MKTICKRISLAIICAVMLSFVTASVSAAESDLITAISGAKVTASSTYNDYFNPLKAIRNTDGKWMSKLGAAADSDSREWLQIDLTKPCDITGIDLTVNLHMDHVPGMVRDFDIMVSNDPTFKTNTIVYSQGDEYATNLAEDKLISVSCSAKARFVRVAQVAGAQYAFAISDIKIYGSEGEALTMPENTITLTSKADNPEVYAVSSGMLEYLNDDYSGSKAIDGTDTPWLSEQNNTTAKWVQIDFGAPHIVTEINILPRGANDVAWSTFFNVMLSNDPSFESYALIHQQFGTTIGGTNGLTITLPDSANEYKYLRIMQNRYQEAGVYQDALQLREITVKGLPTSYIPPEGGNTDLTLYGRANAIASSVLPWDNMGNPNFLLDYNSSTEWISAHQGINKDAASKEWVMIDLGTPRRISEIQIDTRKAEYYNVETTRWIDVELSNDSAFETGVFKCYQRGAAEALNSAGTINIFVTESMAYRYMRVRQTKDFVYLGFQNIRIYGFENPGAPNAPYSATSEISIVKNEEENTVTANVGYMLNTHHHEKSNKAPQLIIALYKEENGRQALYDIDFVYDMTFNVGKEKQLTKTIAIPEQFENYTVKAFLWSDIGTVNPLAKVKSAK